MQPLTHQAHIPITKAAELRHISKQTAFDIWLKFKKKNGSTHVPPHSGRPPKITNLIKQSVICEAKINHQKPFDQIGKLVTPNISASSMQTILHEGGLH
jgi:hypothetical protein